MLDWVDWKHSGIISSSNFIFEPSEFLFGRLNLFPPSCPPGPDDPALILCPLKGPLLIQMPALSAPWPPWDGKQLLDIFQPRNPFCQLEHNCMQEKKKASPSHSLIWPQIPMVKERSWARWIAYSTRSKSKSNKGKVNCVEWIEFYWQQRSPPDCRWTSRTNIAHFWRKYKTNWTQTHFPPILCTVCR